jgi:hypothetical protein
MINLYNIEPGHFVLRRTDGMVCHFWTITEWPDIENFKKFAGNDFEKARYYPEDEKFLLELEEMVIHCETFEAGTSDERRGTRSKKLKVKSKTLLVIN